MKGRVEKPSVLLGLIFVAFVVTVIILCLFPQQKPSEKPKDKAEGRFSGLIDDDSVLIEEDTTTISSSTETQETTSQSSLTSTSTQSYYVPYNESSTNATSYLTTVETDSSSKSTTFEYSGTTSYFSSEYDAEQNDTFSSTLDFEDNATSAETAVTSESSLPTSQILKSDSSNESTTSEFLESTSPYFYSKYDKEENDTLSSTHEFTDRTTSTVFTTSTSTSTVSPETTTSTESSSSTAAVRTKSRPRVKGYHAKVSDTCLTPQCKAVASRILDQMDHSADPCKDFYQYACGGVLDNPFMQPEDPDILADNRIKDMLEKKPEDDPVGEPARTFYQSCLAFTNVGKDERLKFARDLAKVTGEFYSSRVTESSRSESEEPTTLTTLLARRLKMDYAPFFDLSIEVSSSYPSQFVLRLTPPLQKSVLSRDVDEIVCLKEYHDDYRAAASKDQNYTEYFNISDAYEKYLSCRTAGNGMAALTYRLGKSVMAMNLLDHINSTEEQEKLLTETKINTEYLLTDIRYDLPPVAKLRGDILKKKYDTYTLEELDKEEIFGSLIQWRQLAEEVSGKSLDLSTKVNVYSKEAIYDIITRIKLEKEAGENYLFNIIRMMWAEKVYSDFVDQLDTPPDYCLQVTKALLPDVVSYIYLNSFPRSHLQDLTDLVNPILYSIKKTLNDQLERGNISEEIQHKMQFLTGVVGTVEDLPQIKKMAEENTQVLRLNRDYLHNAAMLLRQRRRRMYSLDKNPLSKEVVWNHFASPFQSNLAIIHALNKFVVPYGAMESPYFYPHLMEFLNYGGIGKMIAHEMMHALDTTGINFDGIEKSSLPIPQKFIENSECLNEQISGLRFLKGKKLESTIQFPRNYHLDEVMSETAGIRLAFRAFQSELASPYRQIGNQRHWWPIQKLPWIQESQERLFFLRVVQTQCAPTREPQLLSLMEDERLPPQLRVQLMMENESFFGKVFNCHAERPLAGQHACYNIIE